MWGGEGGMVNFGYIWLWSQSVHNMISPLMWTIVSIFSGRGLSNCQPIIGVDPLGRHWCIFFTRTHYSNPGHDRGGTILPQNDALFSFKMLQNRGVNLNLCIVLATPKPSQSSNLAWRALLSVSAPPTSPPPPSHYNQGLSNQGLSSQGLPSQLGTSLLT